MVSEVARRFLSGRRARPLPGCCINSMQVCVVLYMYRPLPSGYCIPTETIPPSGSNIAGFANEENITVFCEVFNEQNVSQITRWHRAFEGESLISINVVGDTQFTITGDPIPGQNLTFATNLTIVNLTADLDQMLLFCGIPGNVRAATFTMRIYRELT